MSLGRKQEDLHIEGNSNKVVNGNDNSVNYFESSRRGKLASLFAALKTEYANGNTTEIAADLSTYLDNRDRKELKEKLEEAGKSQWYDDFSWCKQEFHKKLLLYQYYRPAQEIFVFIMAVILSKYRNIIKPMLLDSQSTESSIHSAFSKDIIDPLVKLIETEGCDDIMSLTATEVEGIYHYLTGACWINWKL